MAEQHDFDKLCQLLEGDLLDAVMLMGFVFVVMGITFYPERKTERALRGLLKEMLPMIFQNRTIRIK